MPAKGTTKVQNDMRVNRMARLLANGATRSECCQYAAAEWNVAPRTADRYIASARELLRADWEIDRKTFVAELLSQLASLQKEARKTNQPHVALGCINTAARIARVFE
jgi:hypothetical protein